VLHSVFAAAMVFEGRGTGRQTRQHRVGDSVAAGSYASGENRICDWPTAEYWSCSIRLAAQEIHRKRHQSSRLGG